MTAPGGGAAAADADAEAAEIAPADPLTAELTNLLLASSLDYVKSINQTLQALASLLLTTYIALFVALGKEYGFFTLSPVVTALPAACFIAALAATFIRAAAYQGAPYAYGDLDQTLAAYEQAVHERRRQAVLPGVLTLAGIASFAIVVAAAV